jgi:hypothetical protein
VTSSPSQPVIKMFRNSSRSQLGMKDLTPLNRHLLNGAELTDFRVSFSLEDTSSTLEYWFSRVTQKNWNVHNC